MPPLKWRKESQRYTRDVTLLQYECTKLFETVNKWYMRWIYASAIYIMKQRGASLAQWMAKAVPSQSLWVTY